MTADFDAFISYASEDRHPVVSQIARYLRQRGVRIWYDEEELPAGEKLSRMDDGIRRARFGLVFISHRYPQKYWTMQELAGLRAREAAGHLTILPLLVDVEHEFVVDHFPTLAGVKHINAKGRSDLEVAFDIIQIIRPQLAEYMHAKALLQDRLRQGEMSAFPPEELERGPIVHESLSIHVHSRLRLLQASLEDVYDSDIDEWLDNFKRDWHPHKELIWWEFVAALYFKIRNVVAPSISPQEVFDGLIQFIEFKNRSGIHSWADRLSEASEAQVVGLLNQGKAMYAATFGDALFQQLINPDESDR